MTHKRSCHLIAADIGNSAVKLGRFRISTDDEPVAAQVDLQLDGVYPTVVDGQDIRALDTAALPPKRLEALLVQLPATAHRWYAVSVNRQMQAQFSAWLRRRRPQDEYVLLRGEQFPLEIDVRAPECVGTDRLAAAVAANKLRSPQLPAIVVDAGTAITVDVVTSDGVFRGGAILPGIQTAAAALAHATDALPLVEHSDLSAAPAPIGKSTQEAIRSGIVWGCVGAIRELITQMSATLTDAPEIFCTGGDGMHLARLIGREIKFDPNLVLRGIALTGFRQLSGHR